MIVAFAAGIAFAASVPTMAVAGIHTAPAAVAPPAMADVCADETKKAPGFVIVTCKKKAQAGQIILCPQVHAIVPAALRSTADPAPEGPDCRTDTRRADAGTKRLLRPPRG